MFNILRNAALPSMATIVFFMASAASWGADQRHEALDELLRKTVQWNEEGTNTTVDYPRLADLRPALDNYLASLSVVRREDFETWPKPDRLAFLINAYNGFTLQLILDHYPLDSIKDIGTFWRSPWKQEFFTLLGDEMHLDHLEHHLIRDRSVYAEPRIHFAVNCASVGCPALRPEAYTGAMLEQQLQDQTHRFLADRSRNRLNNSRLSVSPIFKWYREDFENSWRGSNSLRTFLARYSDALDLDESDEQLLINGNIDMEFGEYDWTLNDKN
jgi:hypothetical protein